MFPDAAGCSLNVVPVRAGSVAADTHGCTSPAVYAGPSASGRSRT